MEIEIFDEIDSTYTYVCEHGRELPGGYVAHAVCQTGGRGQRGNSWEAEPGKNLSLAMLVRMGDFPARRQFRISEAVSVVIAEELAAFGLETAVKWPNDILAWSRGDGPASAFASDTLKEPREVSDAPRLVPTAGSSAERPGKICGILIAHSLLGASIEHSVIGAGINVNQTEWVSDAPNPVSIASLLGGEYALRPLLERVCGRIETDLVRLAGDVAGTFEAALHARYMQLLWRNDAGAHPFRDEETGEVFTATVYAVEPMGHIVLRDETGRLRRFAFKEVAWL